MSYFHEYKDFLDLTGKNDNVTATKKVINSIYDESIFTDIVLINKEKHNALVKQVKESKDKRLVLKPDTKVDIGSVVDIEEKTYLALDVLDEGVYEIYPTVMLRLCNSKFKIQAESIKEYMRDENGEYVLDKYGRPVEIEVEGEITYEPCIVETGYYFNNRNEQITLPEDRVIVTMRYFIHPDIEVNKRFKMYNSNFKITHINYTNTLNGKGTISITGERVVED